MEEITTAGGHDGSAPLEASLNDIVGSVSHHNKSPSTKHRFPEYLNQEQMNQIIEQGKLEIANKFVNGFFLLLIFVPLVILGVGLFFVLYQQDFEASDLINSVKDFFTLIAGIIGTPLGLVLGYYFKTLEGQQGSSGV